jgi:hypothetical protein
MSVKIPKPHRQFKRAKSDFAHCPSKRTGTVEVAIRKNVQTQAGIAMPAAVIVAFMLVIGTLAIASRNSAGFLAANSQSRNREARDAAESGITQVITILNQEPNRRLLAFGPANQWADAPRFRNICTALSSVNPATPFQAVTEPSGSTPLSPTTAALNLSIGANSTWNNLAGNDTSRQFRVISVEYRNHADRSAAFPADDVLETGIKTLIAITVEGQVQGSSARVTREFEVVPKCCKRSFGNNSFGATFFGRDSRSCFSPSAPGLGVVTSNNGGTVATSGNPFNIIDDQNPPQAVTQVLCRANAPTPNNNCINQNWTLGANISVVPTTFTVDLLPFPPSANTTTAGALNISNTSRYLRVNTSGDVEICNPGNLGSCTNLSNPGLATQALNDAARRCVQEDRNGDGIPENYCKFTQIDSWNTDTIIDTSNGVINLYFDNPQVPPTNSWEYTRVGGNGTFEHVTCPAPQANTSQCTSSATINDAERLNLFAIDEPGSFEFRGSTAALAMNLYAPFANASWRGGGNQDPNFIGRLWVNGLDIRGGISMQVPQSSPGGNVCAPGIPNNICDISPGQPLIDFIARSISQSSSF